MLYEIAKVAATTAVVIITIPIEIFKGCIAMLDNMIATCKSMTKREKAYRNMVYYMRKH